MKAPQKMSLLAFVVNRGVATIYDARSPVTTWTPKQRASIKLEMLVQSLRAHRRYHS